MSSLCGLLLLTCPLDVYLEDSVLAIIFNKVLKITDLGTQSTIDDKEKAASICLCKTVKCCHLDAVLINIEL